jgi:hypothetical protein
MVQLLERPPISMVPAFTHNRRHMLDRRHSLSSLIHKYRWLPAVMLKLGVAFLIILLATWWQKNPPGWTHLGALSGEAAYRWHGFHRIG